MNLTGHNGIINGVCVSPGTTEPSQMVIASASADGSCFLWNLDIGQKCREFHSDRCFNFPCVAFSHDDQLLFAGTSDGKVKIWNRQCTQTFIKYEGFHGKPVAHAALSENGRYVVTSSSDNTCVVIDRWNDSPSWALHGAHQYIRLEGHTSNARGVAISPDNTFIATASWDKTCKIWDLSKGKECLSLKSKSVFRFVLFSSNGGFVVLGGGNPDNIAVVWEFSKEEKYADEEPKYDTTEANGQIPGEALKIAAKDRSISCSDSKNCNILRAHTGEVTSAAISIMKDTTILVVTGSMDKNVIIWQIKDRLITSQLKMDKAHDAPVRAVAMTGDATVIVSGSMDNICKIWDRQTRKLLRVLEGHQGSITSICISKDDQLILSGSYDKTCRIWNRETGKTIGILSNHTGWVNAVAISEDKSCIVTGSEDNTCNCFENLSFLGSTKVPQSSVGDILKILESESDDKLVSDDDFIKLIYPPNLCEVIPTKGSTKMNDVSRNIVHKIVMDDSADLLKHVLKSNPIAVFVKIQSDKELKENEGNYEQLNKPSQSLLYTAIKHDASRCIPIILEYYLYFLNMPDPLGDKEEAHHSIQKNYFAVDLEKAGSEAHPFQLGESLVHPCEWIEIDDFHHLSNKRKYASLYIDFVKSLKLLPQHPCVIGNREQLHNNLENLPKFAPSSNILWSFVLRIASLWEDTKYRVIGCEQRCKNEWWSEVTGDGYDSETSHQEDNKKEAKENHIDEGLRQKESENVPNLYPFIIPIKGIAKRNSFFLDDAVEIAQREERYDIFSSTILEVLIQHKWDTYVARYFYWDFAIFLMMYVTFIVDSLLFTKWLFNQDEYRSEFPVLIGLVIIVFCSFFYFAKYELDQFRSMMNRHKDAILKEKNLVGKSKKIISGTQNQDSAQKVGGSNPKNDSHPSNLTNQTSQSSIANSVATVFDNIKRQSSLNQTAKECVIFIFGEPAQRALWDYFDSGWNWLDILSITAVGASASLQTCGMVVFSPYDNYHYRLMDRHSLFFRYAIVTGIAFPLVSVNMLFYMQGNPTTGALVRMIYKICHGSMSLVIILALITFGFAASFSVLFGNEEFGGVSGEDIKKAYGQYHNALLTVFGFIFANYEIPDVDSSISPTLATALIVIFVAFVSIILLNLLIAIMVSPSRQSLFPLLNTIKLIG
jgi:WD40 repeat protein